MRREESLTHSVKSRHARTSGETQEENSALVKIWGVGVNGRKCANGKYVAGGARARAKEGGKEEAENDSSIGRVASLWLLRMAGGCRHDPPPMVDTAETEAWEPWVIWDIWRSSGRTGAAAGSHEISLSGRSMSSTMFLSQV